MLFDSILTQPNQKQQQGCAQHLQAPEGAFLHKPVACGIDTLVFTAGGIADVSDWFLNQYDLWVSLKKDTLETGNEHTVLIGDRHWVLQPVGSQPYLFQLYNKEIGFIKAYDPNKWASGSTTEQQLHIKLYSCYLHSVGKDDLEKQTKSLVSLFFKDTKNVALKISQVDLHADITHHRMLNLDELSNSITRARKDRQIFADDDFTAEEQELLYDLLGDDWRKATGLGGLTYNKPHSKIIDKNSTVNIPTELLIKLLASYQNNADNGLTEIIRTNKVIETSYFGVKGSTVWAKIYNKTIEAKKKNNEQIQNIWSANGWNGKDTIVRVEFSTKRDFLKQLDNGTYVDFNAFLNNQDKIWSYLTNNWMRLVEEVKRNNSKTSKITSFWFAVINAFNGSISQVVRKKKYNGKANQLNQQGLGIAKTSISLRMVDNDDLLTVKAYINSFKSAVLNMFYDGEFTEKRKLLGLA